MKKIKLSAISLKTTPLDIQGNSKKIITALEDKSISDSALILFPELCITGYGCEDAFYNSWLWKEGFDSLIKILPHTKGKICVFGLPVFFGSYLYNCAVVCSDGAIIGLVPKQNLANTGIHYEKRWFKDGFSGYDFYPFRDSNLPFGNIIFECGDIKFAVEICEDSWVTMRPSHLHAEKGSDIVLSLGASHFAMGKHDVRRRIFSESTRSQNNVFVYSNLNGNESGRAIFDGGCMIYQDGKLLSEGKRLHLTDYEITSATIDIDEIKHSKSRNFRESNGNKENLPVLVARDFELKETSSKISKPISEENENTYKIFTKAVSLGLFDYMLKSGSKGYTVSLSGGADSAACAILIRVMKERINLELGNEFFKLHDISEKQILTTIFQGTENNSDLTHKAAGDLAKEIEAEHYDVKIDPIIGQILSTLEVATGKKFNWKEHDLPLQNVQARARSPVVWFLANLKNHLLISTGNRSEASVGYTTMDGDSSGSICPIAGVSKEYLLEWLHHIANNGEKEFLPTMNSLNLILSKRPTAELKPLSENQEDEKDLMPYPLLQKIEREFVLNGRSSKEIFEILKNDSDISEIDLMRSIEKYISMFKRSQWKRERLPPSFHLDEYGLDAKTSYRFPILSK